MTREEAVAYLPWLPDIKHSMYRRAPFHDYSAPGLYMLTVVVKDRKPLLGTLKVPPPSPVWQPPKRPQPLQQPTPQPAQQPTPQPLQQPGCQQQPAQQAGELSRRQALEARVEASALGRLVLEKECVKMRQVYPMVELWSICLMPDHIHMIVYVNSPLPRGKHLGHVIGGFKGGCTRAWWSLTGFSPETREQRLSNPLFEVNYHDRLLFRKDQLEVWKRYLADNPRRLALKRLHPELFTALYQYPVNGRPCSIVGNRFLLDIPDKMAVVVHRRDSDADYRAMCDRWLACGERGGVLVSAAVAQREKAVMRIAMERGYLLVLLVENGFHKMYKPMGEAFKACSEGRLLQISPWEYHFDKRCITRAQCLELNAIAEAIAAGTPAPGATTP